MRRADLRKLAAVEERMLHRQARPRQERHGQIGPDRGGYDQRKALYPLRPQKFLHLPHFVRLAGIFLPGAVNRGRGQNAVIPFLQASGHRLAARAVHAHCMKEQHGGIASFANRLKLHRPHLLPANACAPSVLPAKTAADALPPARRAQDR